MIPKGESQKYAEIVTESRFAISKVPRNVISTVI